MMMFIDPEKRFELASPYFDEMRENLDVHIRKAFEIMDQKDMSGAKIGLVIDISTDHDEVSDGRSPLGVREAVTPHVSYKLTFKLEAKSESKNDIAGTGSELVRDDTGAYFIVSHEEASGQQSMFGVGGDAFETDD